MSDAIDGHSASVAARRARWLRRLAGAPLLHFALGGALLFALAPDGTNVTRTEDARTITLSADEMAGIARRWREEHGHAPDAAERGLAGLEASTPEILYREAVRLGLDRGDPVIRRRLIEKAGLYLDSLAAAAEPDPATLQAWFDAHRDRFARPEGFTLRRVVFSTDLRGPEAAEQAARSLLATLRTQPESAGEDPDLADSDAWPTRLVNMPRERMGGAFGDDFVAALAGVRFGVWEGPLRSGHAWQLIWLERHDAPSRPEFGDIVEVVRAAYLEANLATERARLLAAMRSSYVVRLHDEAP